MLLLCLIFTTAFAEAYCFRARLLQPARLSFAFFLHAFKLALTHPGTGARMEFTSPLAEDLRAYLG